MLGLCRQRAPGGLPACATSTLWVRTQAAGSVKTAGFPTTCSPSWLPLAGGGLQVFGNDYPAPDGTGIRDYLHVMDLAEAHGITLDHLLQQPDAPALTLNIGTGRGLSVMDVVHGFERATGITIPHRIVPRRPGDVPKLEACPKEAKRILGWRASRSLDDMCRDGWAWQQANPQGYRRG